MSKLSIQPQGTSSTSKKGVRYSITPAKAVYDQRLTDADFRVLAALGVHADSQTGECWRSQTKLARDLGMARTTVNRIIGRLVDLGWIQSTPRFDDDGRQISNIYRVLMDYVPPCHPTATPPSPGDDRDCNSTATGTVTLERRGLSLQGDTERTQINDPIGRSHKNTPARGTAPASACPDTVPEQIYAAYAEARGIDPVRDPGRGKQLAAAKKIADGGFTATEAAGCLRYLGTQAWRDSRPDLATVASKIAEWVADGSPSHAAPRGNGKVLDPTQPISAPQAQALALRQQLGMIPVEAPAAPFNEWRNTNG